MYHDFHDEKNLDLYLDNFLKTLKPKSPKYNFTKELIKDKKSYVLHILVITLFVQMDVHPDVKARHIG